MTHRGNNDSIKIDSSILIEYIENNFYGNRIWEQDRIY